METKTVSRNIARGNQDVRLVEVLTMDDHRLRVEIKSDAYRRQCHARVSHWNCGEWKLVHYIPAPSMYTQEKLYVKRVGAADEFMSEFEADREELLRVAEEILR